MGALVVIGVVLFGAVIFLPQYWVQHVITKHGTDRADLPGTGGELAEHLAGELQLTGVGVETTEKGDHYDPQTRSVRLLRQHHEGKSLAAVAIAAHEIGHAIQHHRGERLLALRQQLAKFAAASDVVASIFFFAAPVLGVIVRTPLAFFGLVAFGVALLSIRVLVHLVTLPVEYDASFNKALPILEQGGYLKPEDMPAIRQVLKAAALTYVAGALVSLLDLARWVRILR
ncbi:zinc metallopeptidase [Salaquimonas pukyongi]|uniref:zinc metallopeptidase n=1 Tax=Salaquimonas pukyongi TaxID=2712698 RepID=UPI00096BB2C8|nr:zinc metallopeptidase [Salaquimonas pukyongi]